jgi:WD40 repeat protein
MDDHVIADEEMARADSQPSRAQGMSGHSRRGAITLGLSLLVGAGAVGAYLEIHSGSGKRPLKGLSAGPENVNALAFAQGDSLLGAGISETGLVFWDVSTGVQAWTAQDQAGSVGTLSLSPRGTTLLGTDGGLSLWNAQSGALIRTLSAPGSASESDTPIDVACFSDDGQRVASGDQGGNVWLWDAASWRPETRIEAHYAAVTAVQFSPDGRVLATGSWDETVRFWDPRNGRRGAEYDASGYVNALVFHPDGNSVFVGTGAAAYRVGVADGQVISEYPGLGGVVGTVCLSPDGRMLAAADDSQTIRVWDIASHCAVATWAPSTEPYALAWSANGSMIATGGEDGIIEIWSAKF